MHTRHGSGSEPPRARRPAARAARHPVARSISLTATVATTLLILGLLAGCGSSSQPSKSSAAASHAPSSTATNSAAATTAQISTIWTEFFSGKTPAAQKEALLQNGAALAPIIAAQASSPMALSTTASVSKVTLTATDQAQVVYTISLGGKPALTNQTGTAVQEAGAWKVGTASFCQLLGLEGQTPPACKAAASSAPSS